MSVEVEPADAHAASSAPEPISTSMSVRADVPETSAQPSQHKAQQDENEPKPQPRATPTDPEVLERASSLGLRQLFCLQITFQSLRSCQSLAHHTTLTSRWSVLQVRPDCWAQLCQEL
eukprot:scaffold13896_cov120-Isochrysis_galbana.AAC.5